MFVAVKDLQVGDKVGPGEGHAPWYTVHGVIPFNGSIDVQVQFADGAYGTRTFDDPSHEVYAQRAVKAPASTTIDDGATASV